MFKVNEYYNGNVKSLAFSNDEGDVTVGVMAPGEYEFNTSTKTLISYSYGLRGPRPIPAVKYYHRRIIFSLAMPFAVFTSTI